MGGGGRSGASHGRVQAEVGAFGDLTSLYTALFGVPPVGKRIFVRATVMVDEFEGLPREFSARVPTASASEA